MVLENYWLKDVNTFFFLIIFLKLEDGEHSKRHLGPKPRQSDSVGMKVRIVTPNVDRRQYFFESSFVFLKEARKKRKDVTNTKLPITLGGQYIGRGRKPKILQLWDRHMAKTG